MSRYSSGKKALSVCDRCGQRYPYNDIKPQIENKRPNGMRVCPPCMDDDHPQLQLGKKRVFDPQSLRDPRPEVSEKDSHIIAFANRFPHTAGENTFSDTTIINEFKFSLTVEGEVV